MTGSISFRRGKDIYFLKNVPSPNPGRVFTSLAHLIDIDFLKEAFNRTRKDGAPGIDEVTAEEYAENLEENLHTLHERLRTGRYKAPVKRVWLDKDDGGKRPIGGDAWVRG